MARVIVSIICVSLAAWWLFNCNHYIVAMAVEFGGIVLAYGIRPAARPLNRNFPFLFQLHGLIDSRSDTAPYSSEVKRHIKNASEGATEVSFGVKEISRADFIAHTAFPIVVDGIDRTLIGEGCSKPYLANVLNISGMGFGPLSGRAVSALCLAANRFGCSVNTGEDGYSSYHDAAENVVMQLGPGYSGMQRDGGGLDRELFKAKSRCDNIVMIEIKLSQGAKPGTGCTLPAKKVTRLVAQAQRVSAGKAIIPSPFHSEFSNWGELLCFVAELREISDGKPVGVKLCVGREDEIDGFISEMQSRNIYPDFITVDGSEGGSGGSTYDFFKYVGMPLFDGIRCIHGKLIDANIRGRVRILASGKIATPYDVFSAVSLGADVCNLGRSVLIALGCEQAMKCHTGKCPTGIATHNPYLESGLVVHSGAERIYKYLVSLEYGLRSLMGASGCRDFRDIRNGKSIYIRND